VIAGFEKGEVDQGDGALAAGSNERAETFFQLANPCR
jgi:hypothetical protein